MRVLIAEDDSISRIMLQNTLKKWGYEPVVSSNGAEAFSILDEDDAPQLAILDRMMPEMDGTDVCRRIRQRKTPPLYIVLLTAKAQRQDLVEGLEAGADDYVIKPFNHQELRARLQVGIRVIELQRKLADRARELETAVSQLQRMQEAQKLEALGRVASGIAHEINIPMQYIGNNIRFLEESFSKLLAHLPAQLPVDSGRDQLNGSMSRR